MIVKKIIFFLDELLKIIRKNLDVFNIWCKKHLINMNDEDCYFNIIDCLEKSTITLASYLLNNLKYFVNKSEEKEVIKNCVILILSYLNEDYFIEHDKRRQKFTQLKGSKRQKALEVLRDEFLHQ